MPHRLYLDEDLPHDLTSALRAFGHDAVHTREARTPGQIDPRQLDFAARHDRALVKANFGDFRMLHEAWLVWFDGERGLGPTPHFGILVVPNPNSMRAPALAELLDAFLQPIDPTHLRNRFFRWRTVLGWEDFSRVRYC